MVFLGEVYQFFHLNRYIYSCEKIKKEILDIFNIYWNDNVKSRFVNHPQTNKYKRNTKPNFRSQDEVYNYYLN